MSPESFCNPTPTAVVWMARATAAHQDVGFPVGLNPEKTSSSAPSPELTIWFGLGTTVQFPVEPAEPLLEPWFTAGAAGRQQCEPVQVRMLLFSWRDSIGGLRVQYSRSPFLTADSIMLSKYSDRGSFRCQRCIHLVHSERTSRIRGRLFFFPFQLDRFHSGQTCVTPGSQVAAVAALESRKTLVFAAFRFFSFLIRIFTHFSSFFPP